MWCDGTNHKVEMDVVTFIEQPDQVFRSFITGSLAEIKAKVAEINAGKSPTASVFYEYCCDKCKEESNG
jgi:hypothetical protein